MESIAERALDNDEHDQLWQRGGGGEFYDCQREPKRKDNSKNAIKTRKTNRVNLTEEVQYMCHGHTKWVLCL